MKLYNASAMITITTADENEWELDNFEDHKISNTYENIYDIIEVAHKKYPFLSLNIQDWSIVEGAIYSDVILDVDEVVSILGYRDDLTHYFENIDSYTFTIYLEILVEDPYYPSADELLTDLENAI